MTAHARRTSDHGFVMVPVIALLVVALGLGIALLAIVDTQTSQGRTQRTSDAAQTLAEGVVTATANALAASPATDWPVTGACSQITGDLTTAPGGATTSLAYRVVTELQTRFAGTSPDYSGTARTTSWKVNVCPVQGSVSGAGWVQSEPRWNDAFLARGVVQPGGAGPGQLSVWIRGQASVQNVGTLTQARARAVASKVKQSSVTFAPPAGYAVGTGSFSTDLTVGLDSVLTNTNGLVGSLTSTVLGASTPLIADVSSKIGLRCGLLSTLDHPSSVCLSGTIAGVNAVTQSANLGVLNTLLGTNRTESLANWTMAPADAIAAWKAEAQTGGVYKPVGTVGGTGSITARTGTSGAPECYADSTTAAQVVYIEQVGNGSQYCTITGTAGRNAAKILIVAKGGVRIVGPFTGVVYALNQGECSGSDGTCSTADHTGAAMREVVRIEGTSGKVIGQVWADGAGGSVGIYPTASPVAPTQTQLINSVGGASGICGTANLGTALNTLQTTLNTVGSLLGALVGNRQVRYPGGAATQPDKCVLLKAKLATMTVAQLETLYQSGGTVSIAVSEHRTCSLLGLAGICIGSYSGWSVDSGDLVNLTIPPLLTDGTLVGQLATVLGSTLAGSNYSAITYNDAVAKAAIANIATGAGPVVGSYRNIGAN